MKTTLKWIGALSLTLLLLVWSCKKSPDPVTPTPTTDDKTKYPNEQRGSNFLSSAEYEAITQIPTPAVKGGRLAALPDSVDLSAEMPPVGNQGAQGSCVGWATTYAVRSYLEHYTKKTPYLNGTAPDNDVLFSPAFVYNQLNGGKDNGLYVRDALDLLKTQGSTTLADMPYQQTDYTTQPTDKQKTKAAGFKLKSWGRVSVNLADMKAFLANKNPIIIAVNVDGKMTRLADKFGAEAGWKTYDPASVRGGHAMVIVGYSTAKNAFKVQNSWGSNWGNKGFFWMSYDLLPYIKEAYTATVEGKEIQVDLPPAGKSSNNFIIGFAFKGYGPDKATAGGDISTTLHTVSVTVVAGTDVTKLVPTIIVDDNATVSPASGVVQDFSKPVVYTVTAENGTKQTYTVTVVVTENTSFLANYAVQPVVENPDPTTVRIKKVMTIQSAPKAADGSAYFYGYADPVANKNVYVGMVKEATNFSFDIEVKGLLPNRKYLITPFFFRTNCDDAAGPEGPTCTKARNGLPYTLSVPLNNDDTKNRVVVKTSDYPDNSDNTISSYRNVRVYAAKGTPKDTDSSLVDLKNGKVYPLKEGAQHAETIDAMLSFEDGLGISALSFYGPSNDQNRNYAIIKSQNWSVYQKTILSYGSLPSSTNPNYDYTWVGGWNNITTASHLDLFVFGSLFNTSGYNRAASPSTYTPYGFTGYTEQADFGFKTADGKKAVARINEVITTSTGYILIMDIKIAK